MKKKLALLLAMVMLFTSLVGCGSKQTETAETKTENETETTSHAEEATETEETVRAFEGVTLNVLGNNSVVGECILENKDDLYEKTGIILNYEQYSNEQLSSKLAVSLAAGSTDIDIMLIRPLDEAALFIENGWAENLSTWIAENPDELPIDEFFPVSLELCSDENGEVYGIPTNGENAVVFYNKTMFAEAGITELPTTIDELYETAALLDDPENGICGFVCRGAGNAAVTQFSCYLRAFGADFFDEEGNAAINTPEAIAAFEAYGKILRDYGPDGVLNMGQPDTWSLFTQGKAAMRIDTNSNMGIWDPDSSAITLDEIGFFQVPVGPNGDHGDFSIVAQAAMMSATSARKDAAWAFLCWLSSAEIQIKMQEHGASSFHTAAWEDNYSSWPVELQEVTAASSAVAVPTDRPLMTNVGQARDIVGEVIVAAIEGETDIAELANEKNAELQELIDSEK